MNRRSRFVTVVPLAVLIAISTTMAQNSPEVRAQQAIDKGLEFLKSQQKPDFSWQGPSDPPGISALVLRAFLCGKKHDLSDPFIAKAFEKLLSYQKPDGGIYNDMLANYNTAIAISALSAAPDGRFKPQVEQAVAFLKKLQWSDQPSDHKERRTVADNDANFGGWGYGRHERPDGSNVQMALDALYDAGVDCNDPAFQNAMKFVSRLQNHSATNDQSWAGNDGGFVYALANNGESMAGEYTGPDGKRLLRSYGSMTYAGLKSFIYAGLTRDDARVKAAWDWITKNWTLEENPGMRLGAPDLAKHGLYYYYHTLGRALNAYDQPVITDSQGTRHDWRVELIDKLIALQNPDGSWVGEQRWMENNPVLVTSYTVLALQEAVADLKQHPVQQVP
jgi:squalene-hopene/tetraprenyl-beta-curcumene cyclase